jgi:hypothetical protein
MSGLIVLDRLDEMEVRPSADQRLEPCVELSRDGSGRSSRPSSRYGTAPGAAESDPIDETTVKTTAVTGTAR